MTSKELVLNAYPNAKCWEPEHGFKVPLRNFYDVWDQMHWLGMGSSEDDAWNHAAVRIQFDMLAKLKK